MVAQIAFAADGQTVMTTSKEYDALNRLTAIASHPGGTPSPASVSFAYTYNAANQRIRRTESDSSYRSYQYDALRQVISGKKYWSDGTPVAGQQFEYAFDHIGNRRTNKFGGDGNSGNLRTALYSANNLNQYTSRTVPGYVNVLGEATNTASVSVNTNLAYRKDRYFRAELSVDNTANPVWLGITNLAVMPVGGGNYVVSNVTGRVFVPKTPEAFTYDADGNLTQDRRWIYTWDGENRQVKVESRTTTPLALRRKVEWQYDALGRRIRQTTSDGSSGSWVVTEDLKFVSDPVLFGRHIAELNTVNGALVHSYVWGLDLSGSLDGAGGVGGLLAVHDASTLNNQPSTHFVCYDGNGNIMALIAASDGAETARYEYGPFGEPLRVTGPMAKENPFRFSTKRTDNTTDLVLYEYRVYNPSAGRWPNRDPIGERGGINLYGFVGNDPIRRFDRLGLDYYIKIVKGTCGVNHRVLVGDDGNGNSFEVEIYPLVKKWYQEYRRFCGKGVIQYTPRTGSATNWVSGEGVKIEKHEDTTPEQDAAIAAKAKSLDGKSITYCLVVQDCRAIEDCVLWGTVSERIKDQLELLWDVIMEQVNPPP